jgi:hypothetical protein
MGGGIFAVSTWRLANGAVRMWCLNSNRQSIKLMNKFAAMVEVADVALVVKQ